MSAFFKAIFNYPHFTYHTNDLDPDHDGVYCDASASR